MTSKFYENVLMVAGAFSDDMDYAKALAEQLVEKAQLTSPEFGVIIIKRGKFYEVLVSVKGMRWVINKNTEYAPMHVPVFRVSKTNVRIFQYFASVIEASYAASSGSALDLYARVFTISQSDEPRGIDDAALAIQEFFLVPGRLITKP